MKPYFTDDDVTLYHGDCLDVLRELPDNSVDAVVTDPPYGISFMGKEWDAPTRMTGQMATGDEQRGAFAYGGTHDRGHADHDPARFGAWCLEWSIECLRVLKPGGHMLAFGGSRTWHRLACAVEDAGFEIRDSIAWLYGSGFPKSLDVAKAIDKAADFMGKVVATETVDVGMQGGKMHTGRPHELAERDVRELSTAAESWRGWGTALKPAFEPIVVGRKPFKNTVAGNVLEHGTGALNIDATRTTVEDDSYARNHSGDRGHAGTRTRGDATDISAGGGSASGAGRWPTNVVLDGSQAAELDKQAPATGGAGPASGPSLRGKTGGSVAYGARNGFDGDPAYYGDRGGASRFFPTFHYEPKAPAHERPRDGETAHPTVKPLDFMRWLVRLVTPPGGKVLDPFAGSGTTAEACIIEGFECIVIERESAYLPLIQQRVSKPIQTGLDFGQVIA